MFIRTIIVEDEPLSRQYICALLGNIAAIEIIDAAATEKEAVEKINLMKPDLVLLDIELHSGTGLQVARNIISPDSNIIFTTALDQQATRIIRMSGMPYVQKPIDANELEKAIFDAQQRSKALKEKQLLYLLETLGNNNLPVHLYLPEETAEGKTFINDIFIIQAAGKNCTISFTNKPSLHTSLSFKDWEEMLCAFHFFRANVSVIVNMNHVKAETAAGDFIVMNNGERVELSAKKRAAFLQKLNDTN